MILLLLHSLEEASDGLCLMLDLHMEAAVLLQHEEFLEHAVKKLHTLSEGDIDRLASEQFKGLHIRVD